MTITKAIAVTLHHGQTLYHKTERNADGSAVRCRVNGQCKTWKRKPDAFILPVKHGFRDCFYIEPPMQNGAYYGVNTFTSAENWATEAPEGRA